MVGKLESKPRSGFKREGVADLSNRHPIYFLLLPFYLTNYSPERAA